MCHFLSIRINQQQQQQKQTICYVVEQECGSEHTPGSPGVNFVCKLTRSAFHFVQYSNKSYSLTVTVLISCVSLWVIDFASEFIVILLCSLAMVVWGSCNFSCLLICNRKLLNLHTQNTEKRHKNYRFHRICFFLLSSALFNWIM